MLRSRATGDDWIDSPLFEERLADGEGWTWVMEDRRLREDGSSRLADDSGLSIGGRGPFRDGVDDESPSSRGEHDGLIIDDRIYALRRSLGCCVRRFLGEYSNSAFISS
jgi:hypothetical protein